MDFISIDIETTSTNLHAAVLAVGVAVVKDSVVVQEYGWVTNDLFHQLYSGAHLDAGTMAWWQNQKEAAMYLFGEPGKSIMTVLGRLSDIIKSHMHLEIWARGPQFDQVVLENAYRRHSMEIPWHYARWRDERTLSNLLPKDAAGSRPQYVRRAYLIPHVALYDAVAQAENIVLIRKYLESKL